MKINNLYSLAKHYHIFKIYLKMISFGVVFFLCQTITAQQNIQKNFIFGLKGGINASAFTTEHTEFNTLFSAGIWSDFYFYKDLGVSLEINYIQRGGILRQIVPNPIFVNPYVDTFYSFDLYVKNKYLDFPFLLKYRIFISNDFLLVPSIGLSYSIPLPFQESSVVKNKKLLETIGLPKFTGQSSYDGAETNTLFGVNCGVALITNRFVLELRYYRAFNEIKGASNVDELNYKIHSVQILLGYYI